MMHKFNLAAVALLLLLLFPVIATGQDDKEAFSAYKKRMQKEYSDYKRQKHQEFDDFRKKANEEYAEFVKKRWEELAALKGVEPPILKPVPPVVCPEEDKQKERKDEKKPYEEVVVVEPPKPQPQPVEPVKPVEPVTPKQETIATQFYGTQMQCTVDSKPHFALQNVSENAVAKAWEQLSAGQCDRLLSQCLELRNRYRLCDWGYIQLLDRLSHKCCSRSNEATLLMAWLYCQSGYKMRLAQANGKLYMLYASENVIYQANYFTIDKEKFYPYKGERLKTLYVCGASFPKEKTMTLKMNREPKLTHHSSNRRTLKSERYSNIKVTTFVNKNLIDFYNDYPTGSINNDFGTRWAMYANTPLCNETRQNLYTQLKRLLSGKDKLEAAEELLNFVQTAFVYEYDDTVWGHDRAFFAEETLFYPYADCEDRSILFSRLVRDLLGLDVVLLYYPGHLATAVKFEGETPTGDYLPLSDGNYYVADPTYIGAPIGMSMPSVKGTPIKVIVISE